MNTLSIDELNQYVNANIVKFHENRLRVIQTLTLEKLLNKNPYLFKAKNINKAHELVEGTMEAFLSSSEEKIFGDFLEGLAIFVASKTTGGHKSSCQGVDLEFEKENTYYLVTIKSGTNWGNSSQHKKLADDLRNAEIRLKQSKSISKVQSVLGICYGKTKTGYTSAGYLKIVGQNFWTFISGNKNLYLEIIEPVGYRAKEHNDRYLNAKAGITNVLIGSFIDKFCDSKGVINWEKVVKANSGNGV